jgi:hypothetical protein
VVNLAQRTKKPASQPVFSFIFQLFYAVTASFFFRAARLRFF